jgi:hypothetical protein
MTNELERKLTHFKLDSIDRANPSRIMTLFRTLYVNDMSSKKKLLEKISERDCFVAALCVSQLDEKDNYRNVVYSQMLVAENKNNDEDLDGAIIFEKSIQFLAEFIVVTLLLDDIELLSLYLQKFIEYRPPNIKKRGEKKKRVLVEYFDVLLDEKYKLDIINNVAVCCDERCFSYLFDVLSDILPNIDNHEDDYGRLIAIMTEKQYYNQKATLIMFLTIKTYLKYSGETANNLETLSELLSNPIRQRFIYTLALYRSQGNTDYWNTYVDKATKGIPHSIKYLYLAAMEMAKQSELCETPFCISIDNIEQAIMLYEEEETLPEASFAFVDNLEFVEQLVAFFDLVVLASDNPLTVIRKMNRVNIFDFNTVMLTQKIMDFIEHDRWLTRKRILAVINSMMRKHSASNIIDVFMNTHLKHYIDFREFTNIIVSRASCFDLDNFNEVLSKYVLTGKAKYDNNKILLLPFNVNAGYIIIPCQNELMQYMEQGQKNLTFRLKITGNYLLTAYGIEAVKKTKDTGEVSLTAKEHNQQKINCDKLQNLYSLLEMLGFDFSKSTEYKLSQNDIVREDYEDKRIAVCFVKWYFDRATMHHRNSPSTLISIIKAISYVNPYCARANPMLCFHSELDPLCYHSDEDYYPLIYNPNSQALDMDVWTICDSICRNAYNLGDAVFIYINTLLKYSINIMEFYSIYKDMRKTGKEREFTLSVICFGLLIEEDKILYFVSMDMLHTENVRVDKHIIAEGVVVGSPVFCRLLLAFKPNSGIEFFASDVYDEVTYFERTGWWDNKEEELPLVTYILNLKRKTFHLSSCDALPNDNRFDSYDNRDTIIAQGYKPCGQCCP